MDILFISDNFPPEVNAPASRTYEHAKQWVADGVQVTILTCAPNFPQGRVYKGYKNSWRNIEYIDGIRVVRVKTYITKNSGFLRRTLDYLSFMFSAALFGSFEKRPVVVVGTSPQFFAACAAWLLSIRFWRPFVFELRDLWPASIVTVGAMKGGMLISLMERLELFLYKRSALVISVTESFKNNLVRRGIDADKVHIVRNGVDLSRFHPQQKCAATARAMGVEGKFVVGYLGTHGMAHALENIVDAATLLKENKDIVFLLVGDGAGKEQAKLLAEQLQLENIIFHAPIPKNDMPNLWSICDIALVHLKDDPVFADVIPSKIFEAFGMGRPVLMVQPRGEAVDIVEVHGAGVWVQPGSPDALAKNIKRLRGDKALIKRLSKNSLKASELHSRSREAQRMLRVLKATTTSQTH